MALLHATPADAAKWHTCPAPPLPVYPSALGATSSPFAHPGHVISVVLNSSEVASGGGFSLEPDGNAIEVAISPAFGARTAFALRRATATSASVLSFAFPDAAAEVGRVLAGPAEIRVTAGGKLVARIDATDLVALPPATDVTALVLGQDSEHIVYAALAADGDLWVPAAFHGDPMAMPTCPGQFLVPQPVELAAAEIPGAASVGQGPIARIRKAGLYIGDLDISGTSFYGMLLFSRLDLVHANGTRGVCICRLNDAVDVVLRVKGNRSWARSPHSPLREVVRGGAPVPLRLQGARAMPATARASVPFGQDTFGSSCAPQPPIARGTGGHP